MFVKQLNWRIFERFEINQTLVIYCWCICSLSLACADSAGVQSGVDTEGDSRGWDGEDEAGSAAVQRVHSRTATAPPGQFLRAWVSAKMASSGCSTIGWFSCYVVKKNILKPFDPSSNNSTHRLMTRRPLFSMTATHWRRRNVSRRSGGSLRNRRSTLRGRERTSQKPLFAWDERFSALRVQYSSKCVEFSCIS